jgi:hypothetical protein
VAESPCGMAKPCWSPTLGQAVAAHCGQTLSLPRDGVVLAHVPLVRPRSSSTSTLVSRTLSETVYVRSSAVLRTTTSRVTLAFLKTTA